MGGNWGGRVGCDPRFPGLGEASPLYDRMIAVRLAAVDRLREPGDRWIR